MRTPLTSVTAPVLGVIVLLFSVLGCVTDGRVSSQMRWDVLRQARSAVLCREVLDISLSEGRECFEPIHRVGQEIAAEWSAVLQDVDQNVSRIAMAGHFATIVFLDDKDEPLGVVRLLAVENVVDLTHCRRDAGIFYVDLTLPVVRGSICGASERFAEMLLDYMRTNLPPEFKSIEELADELLSMQSSLSITGGLRGQRERAPVPDGNGDLDNGSR